MAVFVPVVNGLHVNMQFTTSTGDAAQSGFWVKRTAAWDVAHVNTMMNAFITWFGTGDGAGHTYKSAVSQDCSLTQVSARDNTIQNGISLATNAGLPIAGTDPNAQAAPGLTWALTQRTGLAGKSFRGRTFMVGMPTDAWSSMEHGSISSTFANDSVLAFNALIGAVNAADPAATLVVVSRYYQPGGPHTPTVPRATGVLTPVTAYGYHNLVQDFQRRRSPQHHRHA